MSLLRCTECKRGLAGSYHGEKEATELTSDEVVAEKGQLQAKLRRLQAHADDLATTTTAIYPSCDVCPVCMRGWREFDNGTKDLRQLDADATRKAIQEARSALQRVIARETELVLKAASAAMAQQ